MLVWVNIYYLRFIFLFTLLPISFIEDMNEECKIQSSSRLSTNLESFKVKNDLVS